MADGLALRSRQRQLRHMGFLTNVAESHRNLLIPD